MEQIDLDTDGAIVSFPGGEEDDGLRDADRDALHILPLSTLPLQTKTLRRWRMVKNGRLESMIEAFDDADTGSGQLTVDETAAMFGWREGNRSPDYRLLMQVAPLPSYDVFSLRILLRDLGIQVNRSDALRLSDRQTRELSVYMTRFTRPLVREIYGDDAATRIETFDDIVNLFRDPDVDHARRQLDQMARKLGISMMEIPKFLEDYSDIFLSLSYYRRCLDAIMEPIEEVLNSLHDIREHFQMQHDPAAMLACKRTEVSLNEAIASLTGRFESFDRATDDLWRDLSADRFRRVQKVIRDYHVVLGGVLCSLTVVMKSWQRQFPNADSGGPVKRASFLITEFQQSIDKIEKIEDSRPTLASVA